MKASRDRRSWCQPLLALTAWIGFSLHATAAEQVLQTPANEMVERTLTASSTHDDPINTVTLDVIFTDPKGHEIRVPAFWAGGSVWKVRYASSMVGSHRFRSECSDAADAGLHGIEGRIEITPYTGKNPLYARGPLHVSEDHRYLQHNDGTPFFWLGDTWWMGLCHRLHWPDEFKTLAADRKEKGFTVIQIVAGLYPDMPPFDPRGANEAGFPWEKDFARIRPEYFDAADQRLAYLVEQGLTPCIVGAWGYFIPLMGVEKAKQHWRYLVARYGAYPVVWCVAGEANLPYYLAKGFPYDDRQQVKEWTKVARYLRETDPFHRLITIHPTGINRLSARNAIDDVSLLDIDMLQTPHGQREAVPPTVRTVRESYADKPVMPVINGEASYEMLLDKIPAEWTRRMFWLCMMNGAAGHTYGANGIWQCNRRGEPHGKSPHGGTYGVITWDEAMKLPGSAQVAHGKKLLEQYAWQDFRPHPEWAEFSRITPKDTAYGPQCAGIPDRVRLIYVPDHEPIVVRHLGPRATCAATYFDPVSGARKALAPIQADDTGSWNCQPPAGQDHDWVLILEPAAREGTSSQQGQNNTSGQDRIGRPVRVVSIGFRERPLEKVIDIVDREAARGADLIILPETWTGHAAPETLEGKTISTLGELAKKYNTYIVCPIDRKDADRRYNSAVLIDRGGQVAGVYDKVFPYWAEFDITPPADIGTRVPVFETDFGRIGFAICFDVNFPEVWQALADQGAELVVWPSAYSAGTSLQAHAINHHFYIVTSTLRADCLVYDITGEQLLYEKSKDVNVSRITLDLDRGIYHENFNIQGRDKLMKEHAEDVTQEKFLDLEEWFVLKAQRPGVSARELARKYGLEELRDYINRSRQGINKRRGMPFGQGSATRSK